MKGLHERIMEELKNKIDRDILQKIPRRIPIIGGVAILSWDPKLMNYAKDVGSALLKHIPNVRSVWIRVRTIGIKREPQMIHVAGDKNPVVIHKELRTFFKLDISRITFSPGNTGERARLLKLVKGKILDMFACVGNLSMPLAVHGFLVYMIEINPLAYKYLLETIRLNKVERNVVPMFIDNHYLDLKDMFDHVLMGFLPEPDIEQLAIAINAVKKRGGWIHYHCVARRDKVLQKVSEVKEMTQSLGANIEKLMWRKVKGVAPNVWHIVIRMYVRRR